SRDPGSPLVPVAHCSLPCDTAFCIGGRKPRRRNAHARRSIGDTREPPPATGAPTTRGNSVPPAAAAATDGAGGRACATLAVAATSAASATATSTAVTASRVAPSDADGATLPITNDPAVVLRAGDASPVRPNGKRKTSSAKSGGAATKAGTIASRAA